MGWCWGLPRAGSRAGPGPGLGAGPGAGLGAGPGAGLNGFVRCASEN